MLWKWCAKAVGETLKGFPFISVPHSRSPPTILKPHPLLYLRECGANDYSGFCHFNSHYPLHLFYYFVRYCFCFPRPFPLFLFPTVTVIVGWSGWQDKEKGVCLCNGGLRVSFPSPAPHCPVE